LRSPTKIQTMIPPRPLKRLWSTRISLFSNLPDTILLTAQKSIRFGRPCLSHDGRLRLYHRRGSKSIA
jgi:hypothetical protein